MESLSISPPVNICTACEVMIMTSESCTMEQVQYLHNIFLLLVSLTLNKGVKGMVV